jgi:hypothetical protein
MRIFFTAILLSILIFSKNSIAQAPKNIWQTALYISSVYNTANKADTLTGTAFLISDDKKLYLVTAKHLVGRSLSATDQKQINKKIYIGTSTKNEDIGVLINDLDKLPAQLEPYIFSDDGDDIAIISLQKTGYEKVVAAITDMGIVATDITSFEVNNTLPTGTLMLHHSWFTYKTKMGHKTKMQGIFNKDTLKSVSNKTALILLKSFYRQGFDGAPLFTMDNKLAGMIINGEGYLRNADIIANPYKTGKFATAVKSSQILFYLKKMQEIELQPGFK